MWSVRYRIDTRSTTIFAVAGTTLSTDSLTAL